MTPETYTTARIYLMEHQPFFGHLSMIFPTEEMTEGTAATDGSKIFIGPVFHTMPKQERAFVIAHELYHNILYHFTRRLPNHEKDNIAGDHAINLLLCNDNKLKMPEGCYCDPQYTGMSKEEIYYKLKDSPENKKHNGKGAGKDLRPGTGTPAEMEQAKEQIKEAVCNAARHAERMGKLSGDMKRLIDSVINPAAPWREILQQFVSKTARNDYSYRRISRSAAARGYVAPTMYSQQPGSGAIAVDTSGSVDNRMLGLFQNEISGVLDAYDMKLRVIYCDAKIHGEEEISREQPLMTKPQGGGGTDFNPIFDLLEQDPPEFLIYITDGYGKFPDKEPAYPVLWCIVGGYDKIPFGQTVNIGE